MIDGVGGVRALADERGAVTDRYAFNAMGDDLTQTLGTTPNPYTFKGAYGYYNEGPRHHVGARYYASRLGRFTQVDPVRQGFNHDQHAFNNPLIFEDPTGLSVPIDAETPDVGPGDEGAEGGGGSGPNKSRDSHSLSDQITDIEFTSALLQASIGTGLYRAWKYIQQLFKKSPRLIRNGASDLPDLTGKTRSQADDILRDHGFRDMGTTSGGYRKYYHPDGSRVQIRPNGEIVRTGPKIQNPDPNRGGYRPRIGPDGKPTDNHNTGEFLE